MCRETRVALCLQGLLYHLKWAGLGPRKSDPMDLILDGHILQVVSHQNLGMISNGSNFLGLSLGTLISGLMSVVTWWGSDMQAITTSTSACACAPLKPVSRHPRKRSQRRACRSILSAGCCNRRRAQNMDKCAFIAKKARDCAAAASLHNHARAFHAAHQQMKPSQCTSTVG